MYIGTQPYSGIRARHTYTATAGQTSFSGAGAENVTLTYADELYIDVYQNGVKLSPADYTATSGTTVVLATGATVSDIVEVIKYDAFSVADTVSAKDGGGFGGNISTSGTLAVTGTSAFTGAITSNAGVVVDNITIDGTEIDLSSGDLTLDVAGDLIIDTDGAEVKLKDGGTLYGKLHNHNPGNAATSLIVESSVQDQDILLKGNDGGSVITALALDMSADGHATFKNGVTLTDGNLIVASGHGIDFSAAGNAGGMGSELLDDYEEGTFTPILQNSGGVQVNAYSLQTGFYTKVGRLVHASGTISANGLGSAGSGNGIFLGGLPFDSLSTSNNNSPILISHAVNLNVSAGQTLGGFLPANSTNVQLFIDNEAQGSGTFTFGELSADGQLTYAIQYQTP
jgi:hypothetical protein